MSLRLENFAGIVWPKDPIGPEGAGSLAAPAAPELGDTCCVAAPVVAAAASPVDGCFDTGVINAARASSGVGRGAGAAPGLLGVVFWAWAGAASDDKMSVAARAIPAPDKYLFFIEASIG